MSRANQFVERVLQRVRADGVRAYEFHHWSLPGKVTEETVGLLPVPDLDPEALLARVLDVNHYVGNVDHVVECRSVADPAIEPTAAPGAVRFYQRIKVPLLGDVHHELVLRRLEGAPGGFQIAAWEMLERETEALPAKRGIRSAYNDGAWLVAPGLVGYALSSCPRREDVGLLKWKAMTSGAEMAASRMIRENIEGMVRWSKRP